MCKVFKSKLVKGRVNFLKEWLLKFFDISSFLSLSLCFMSFLGMDHHGPSQLPVLSVLDLLWLLFVLYYLSVYLLKLVKYINSAFIAFSKALWVFYFPSRLFSSYNSSYCFLQVHTVKHFLIHCKKNGTYMKMLLQCTQL